jgi:hypothetical protein
MEDYEYNDSYYEVCLVRGQVEGFGWIVDSRATSHFTHDLSDFDTLEDCKSEVAIGNGTLVKLTKKGTVKFWTDGGHYVTLTDVKYMPEGHFHILSPGALISKGAKANFYKGGVDITFGDKCIFQVNRLAISTMLSRPPS